MSEETATVHIEGDDIQEEDICFEDGEFDEVDVVDDGSGRDAETNQFDAIVGALQDVLVDPAFEEQRESFCRQHCQIFEDSEENKLEYTAIFSAYTEMVEAGIDSRLRAAVPGFDMTAFLNTLAKRKDELMDEVFDLLCSMGDFETFKEVMLAYKHEKTGLFGDFMITCTPLRLHDLTEEQADGEERNDLKDLLQISPVGPGPQKKF